MARAAYCGDAGAMVHERADVDRNSFVRPNRGRNRETNGRIRCNRLMVPLDQAEIPSGRPNVAQIEAHIDESRRARTDRIDAKRALPRGWFLAGTRKFPGVEPKRLHRNQPRPQWLHDIAARGNAERLTITLAQFASRTAPCEVVVRRLDRAIGRTAVAAGPPLPGRGRRFPRRRHPAHSRRCRPCWEKTPVAHRALNALVPGAGLNIGLQGPWMLGLVPANVTSFPQLFPQN